MVRRSIYVTLALSACSTNTKAPAGDAQRGDAPAGDARSLDAPVDGVPDALPPGQARIYFAVPGSGIVAYAIAAAGTLTASGSSATSSGVPWSITSDAAGENLFVGHNDFSVYVNRFALDPVTGAPGTEVNTGAQCTQIARIAIDPKGRFAYYSCKYSAFELVEATLSGGTMTAIAGSPIAIDSVNQNPYVVAIDATGSYAYVAGGYINAKLYRYDITATGALANQTTEASTTGSYVALSLAPNGKVLYTSTGGEIDAYSIDGATGQLTLVGSVLATAYGIAIDPTGHFLYAPGNSGINGFVLDPVTGALTAMAGNPFAIPGGALATTGPLAVSPLGNVVYEADANAHVYAFAIASSGTLTSLGSVATLPTNAQTALAIYAR